MRHQYALLFLLYSLSGLASMEAGEIAGASAVGDCEERARLLQHQATNIPTDSSNGLTGKQVFTAFSSPNHDPFGEWSRQNFTGSTLSEHYTRLTPEEATLFDREFQKRLKKLRPKDWTDVEYFVGSIRAYLGAEEALANSLWTDAKRLARTATKKPDAQVQAQSDENKTRAAAIYKDVLAKYIEVFRTTGNLLNTIPLADKAQMGGSVASILENYLEANQIPVEKFRGIVPHSNDSKEYVMWEVAPNGSCSLCGDVRKLQAKLGPDYTVLITPFLFWSDSNSGFLDRSPPRYFMSPFEVLNLSIGDTASIDRHYKVLEKVAKSGAPMDFSFDTFVSTENGIRSFSLSGAELLSRSQFLKDRAKSISADSNEKDKFGVMLSSMQLSELISQWDQHTAKGIGEFSDAQRALLEESNHATGRKVNLQFELVRAEAEELNLHITSPTTVHIFPMKDPATRKIHSAIARTLYEVRQNGASPDSDRRTKELQWDLLAALKLKLQVGNRFGFEMQQQIQHAFKDFHENMPAETLNSIISKLGEMKVFSLTRRTLRTQNDPNYQNAELTHATGPAIAPSVNAPKPAKTAVVLPSTFLHHAEGFKAAGKTKERDVWADKIAMTAVEIYGQQKGWQTQNVSKDASGDDLHFYNRETNELLRLEVKSKTSKKDSVSFYHSEVRNFVDKPESMLLAIVWVDPLGNTRVEFRQPIFTAAPDHGEITRAYKLSTLLQSAPLDIPDINP